ncbi:S8 family serine peptidase [Lentzea sp. NPDC059081]|uniref:S8 family peptidase n=1 Tax=Lentzea sp. NPDC059081 TaxID=3346719 RepID=UPI0036AE1849
MRGKTKVLSAVTALALTAAPVAVATAAPPAPAPRKTAPQQAVDEVTLVTGDRVLLGPGQRVVAIEPGEGRDTMRFRTLRGPDGHTAVIPQDAFGPLAAGRLDRRLFDVTTLLEFGYRDRMPLIVNGGGRLGARSTGDWNALRLSGDKIWLDGIRRPVLDRSVAQIGAPAAHQRGITGKGIKVAIVDTGVDEKHPDLVGQQVAEKNFTTDPDNTDTIGHGTHVGSTVASHDAKYGGVAPGAQLLDAKVCTSRGCPDSAVIAGMRWAVEQGAQVVNMSLSGPDTPEVDPVEQAVDELTARYGTLFVIGAGNSGSPGTVGSPSTAEAALSVGAVDRDDQLASFSSKGPRIGDSGLKPEVTAPGVGIVAAAAGTNGGHVAASGTSMATPHVAGAAALLRQEHPEWTPAQVKSALATTAKPTAGVSAFDQGAGRIDVSKAIDQVLTGDVTVNLGKHEWPHDDDKPEIRPITYTNPTGAAITLDLTLTSTAPRGMIALSASKVTVPAKGTASVDVIGDTRADTQNGAFTGEVVATSGTHTVRTLVGIDREEERYTLAVDFTDRDGKDPASSSTFLVGLDNSVVQVLDTAGDLKIRLPRGTYVLETTIGTDEGLDLLVQPNVVLTADTAITQDARLAKPLSITPPEAPGDSVVGELAWRRTLGSRTVASTLVARGGFDGIRTAQGGGPLSPAEMASLVTLQTDTAAEAGTYFRLSYPVGGSLPTGLTRAPRKEDLARVEATISGLAPGSTALKGELPASALGLYGGGLLYRAPESGEVVDYVTTEGLRWQSSLLNTHANGAMEQITSGFRTYQAGRTYQERENRPVYSPGLPETPYPLVTRRGPLLIVGVPLVSDASNGIGYSTLDSARTALYRDGVLLDEAASTSGYFEKVPLSQGDYRAEMSLDRSSQFEFSTKVSGVWTFRSTGTEGRTEALPLSVVRFAPQLDSNGAVPAGTLQRIGLSTQSQGDTGAVRITGVQYSHDDGKSWRPAGVSGASALVYNPLNAEWTSLKATTVDAKGNTSEVTVIHAYRLS